MNGRVIEVQRIHTTVLLDDGRSVLATVRGEFHESGAYPKVGDYVSVSLVHESEEAQAVIEELLPRHSVIVRYDEISDSDQVLVANVNLIIIVMGLDGDYNISRLERYLALAAQSNIAAIVVLNKMDVVAGEVVQARQAEVQAAAGSTPVLLSSAPSGRGLDAVVEHITPDTTAVLRGSSGAGKSTITNWLLGNDQQETAAVRGSDSKGRHTTTTRQLFSLPGGGCLIDTPGMRELALSADESSADDTLIAQVEALAAQCQFRNCDHDKSAGCAVVAAVASGELNERLLDNYYKLMRERAWQADKTGSKDRYKSGTDKRSAQAAAAAFKKRRMRGQ